MHTHVLVLSTTATRYCFFVHFLILRCYITQTFSVFPSSVFLFRSLSAFGNDAPAAAEQNPFGNDAPAAAEQNPFGNDAPAAAEQNPFGNDAPAPADDANRKFTAATTRKMELCSEIYLNGSVYDSTLCVFSARSLCTCALVLRTLHTTDIFHYSNALPLFVFLMWTLLFPTPSLSPFPINSFRK